MNELASMFIQEEVRLKQQWNHLVHSVSQGANKKWKKAKKSKKAKPPRQNEPLQGSEVHEMRQNSIYCISTKGLSMFKRFKIFSAMKDML